MTNHWRAVTTLPALQAQDIQVWRVNLRADAAQIAYLTSLLSANEQARAARYHFARDQHSFVICRGVLRTLLGAYLDCTAASIAFRYGTYGKPIIAAPGTTLQFNVSHSADIALIAVAWNTSVGVDVERMRPDVAVIQLIERFFSPTEIADIGVLDPNDQLLAFYQCWTRKEAYIKARGIGLSLPLDTFTVAHTAETPTVLHADDQPWAVHSFVSAANYAAAVASNNPTAVIQYLNYDA